MKRYDEILFIGPRSRGGMDAVLEAYGAMMPGARFVASYHGGSKLRKMLDFGGGYLRAAWLLLRYRDIKIVHLHSASGASFRRKMWFARLAHFMGRKVVMHIHSGRFGEYFATNPKGISTSLNRCDEVICLSRQWYDFLSSHGVNNLNVVPNPVAYPENVERDHDAGRVNLLFLGVLDKAKGVVDLVEAMSMLSSEVRRSVVLHIAGAGAEESVLKAMINNYGLEKSVILEGWISGEAKRHLLSTCHCFVLPSYYEGLPVSILECMAWGMPVISSPVGGIPSVVKQDENGFLVKPGDTKELAAAITSIVTDKALRQSMGCRSREIVKSYSPPIIAQALDEIYTRLL